MLPKIGKVPTHLKIFTQHKMSHHLRKEQLKMRKKKRGQWFSELTIVLQSLVLSSKHVPLLVTCNGQSPAFWSVCTICSFCGVRHSEATKWTQAEVWETQRPQSLPTSCVVLMALCAIMYPFLGYEEGRVNDLSKASQWVRNNQKPNLRVFPHCCSVGHSSFWWETADFQQFQ